MPDPSLLVGLGWTAGILVMGGFVLFELRAPDRPAGTSMARVATVVAIPVAVTAACFVLLAWAAGLD
ncbi:hypothetical protein [Agrococcus jenensis]|uniref:Uncharacterized protein n=1 Tax=Agrococcus jenensis TaxID=46353 RepID=A0A3N2AV32_9MICO|nr:hypothetical protein [Agrococcus jenensis]ROR66830.1 hypothetical protein EDD26_2225 [Agrococcus jenensis]